MDGNRSLDGHWSCLKCTLENVASTYQCEACGNVPFAKQISKSNQNDCDVNPSPSSSSSSKAVVAVNTKKTNGILSMLNDVRAAAARFMSDKPNIVTDIKIPQHQIQQSEVDNFHLPEVEDTTKPKTYLNKEYQENGHCSNINAELSDVNEFNKTRPKVYKRQTSTSSVEVRKEHEQEAVSQWQEIVNTCKELNTPFVDDSFPPSSKSLTFSACEMPHVFMWLRPHQILSRNKIAWEVFRNPRPSDIVQGVIGNCWFLSALAVVAEKSELLEQIVITKKVCKQGIYQVRICKNGKWEVVFVDDLIPCDRRATPVYSQAGRNQLWVPLIEKAVAKSVGCYEALVAGRCIEALQMLTGMPCESVPLQSRTDGPQDDDPVDIDMIWAKILTCRNAGYLMGASCGGDVVNEMLIQQYHSVGLEAQHAYSVLDIQQVGQHRLIRLRNPWGRFSWTGAWSDSSPMWTDELRVRLNPYGSVEGVFWISLEDMMNYFDCIDVCKYQPEWTEVALCGNFASPLTHVGQVCHLTVFAPTELDITLFQESNRGSEIESIASLDLMVGVYRAQAGTCEPKLLSFVSHSNRKIKPSVLCNVFLEEGIYVIIPFAFNHWNSGVTYTSPPKYVLSMHSSKPVLTDHIPMPRYSYSDALFMMVERLGKKHEGIAGVTCYYLSDRMAGLIVAAENRRTNVHLHVSCDCSNSFNVVSTRGSLSTNDCLPPLHRQILTVLTQLEGADGYAVIHKLRFKASPMNSFGSYGSHQDPLLLNGLGELHNPRPL